MIGIDPGPRFSAVCLYHSRFSIEAQKVENERLIEWLSVDRKYPLAIEFIESFGMPVGAEVFQTCRWVGRFEQAYQASNPSSIRLVYRSEVKLHLCGSLRAKDTNIRQALIDRFGAKGTKGAPGILYGMKADMYSALAVALTAVETEPKLNKGEIKE